MSTGTSIQWTEATWNPVSGCTRVSAGCDHCYAVKQSYRLEMMGQVKKYGGLTVLNNAGDRHFNGVVRCDELALTIPLKWKKPRTIFVNSMSDLFHKDVPFEFIDKVFAVMALCPQHTFQVLTKRPERMAEYLGKDFSRWIKVIEAVDHIQALFSPAKWSSFAEGLSAIGKAPSCYEWPRSNVWLGTSCENQQTADERIPHLLKCPAAVRFISAEPLLGSIDLEEVRIPADALLPEHGTSHGFKFNALRDDDDRAFQPTSHVDWVIVGGESGGGSRPCNVEWVRSIVGQCQAAGVACFVKQLGKKPVSDGASRGEYREQNDLRALGVINDPKGGNPDEWPADLRVRELPQTSEATR